jgi:hypothetical protein
LIGNLFASKTFIEAGTMFRLLGILIGSIISVVAILMVTGIPDFHLEDPAIDQKRFDDAVEKLMVRKREAEQHAQTLANDVVAAAETVQEDFASREDESFAQTELPEAVSEQVSAETVEDPSLAAAELDDPPPISESSSLDDMQWYSFWTPFRSRIAAGGFVARLEEVTGLDYRVVKIKTGIYEVAFAYDSDDERRNKLSQISAATGLDLPGS